MIFFSEICGKKVYTLERLYVGKVQDLIFVNTEIPKITKLVISDSDRKLRYFPIENIVKLNSHITIRQGEDTHKEKHEISLIHTLLDKQVIDLVGNKIVRVNDVAIQNQPTYSIFGIDISWLGILRRLGVADSLQKTMSSIHIPIHEQFLSWADIQNLEISKGQIQLKERQDKLARIHPEDLADYLEMTHFKNAKRFLNSIEEEQAAEVFESLQSTYQTKILEDIEPEKAAKLLDAIDPDEAVDVLLTLDESRSSAILYLLPTDKRAELTKLLKLSESPVGNLMTTEFLIVPSSLTVREVISTVYNKTQDFSSLTYVYISNDSGLLVGVMSLQELLLQRPDVIMYKCMVQNPITISLTTPVEIVVKKILRYKLFALPVVDHKRKLLGIVTIDDLSELILQKYI